MVNIILDLDSTLIVTDDGSKNTGRFESLQIFGKGAKLKNRIYHFRIGKHFYWGIYRPYVEEFMRWAEGYFDNVIIWSAGTSDYVKKIVRHIYIKSKLQFPKIIWSRDKCVKDSENNVYKNLGDLFKHPEAVSLNINESNTVIIDDNALTFKVNSSNAIHIPEYKPSFDASGIDEKDTALTEVMSWFQTNVPRNHHGDVRKLKLNKIFNY